jgi:hypothetical protein
MPIQLIIRNPLDRDAREYIQRAGVSDAGGRLQLNEFVRGVKGLGLWDSMICWPLRSTQNAGTGTTVYSLGGRFTSPATLINGPAWGTKGIAVSSNTHRISSDVAPTQFATLIIVRESGFLPLTTNWSRLFFSRPPGIAGNSYGMTHDANFVFDHPQTDRVNGSFTPTINTSYMTTGSATPTGSFLYANTSLVASNSTAPPMPPSGLLYNIFESGSSTVNHIYSFALLADIGISQSQVTSFYGLYKNTLGVGLTLP